ncbi:hypothetical protein evm_008325 [Chilo suppressalis]|nr:hypothetical protein evm_008325 [Chilo suppressalis]
MRKRCKSILTQQLDIRNELNCQHCGKEFKYESERKRHEQSHSPQFTCKICLKKFSFMSALRRHEKQHERTGSVSCGQCNRKFRDESLLKRHMKYAHKGTFSCIKCSAVFNSDLALHSHMKIHKPESERRYRCSFTGCKKSFNFAHHLKHHELTHTNTKQYFCSVCGKGFIQYHHLKSHEKIHKPEGWLTCSFPGCKKFFATEHTLRKHIDDTHKNNNASSEHSDLSTISINETTQNDYDEFADIDSKPLTDSDFIVLENEEVQDWREQYLEKLENQYSNSGAYKTGLIENEELTILQKVDALDLNEEEPISNCKSSLGGCIMGEDGNSKQKCLCAQIQPNAISIEDTYELLANKTCKSINKMNVETVKLKPIKINNSCDDCGCTSDISYQNIHENYSNCRNVTDEIIDYNLDGTIRIKSSFDIDIEPILDSNENINIVSSGVIMNTSPSDKIPFNSCKEVLGNCIVSGNGTISEGCLCAKMALDDQQMLDQEINELTPCPKT